MVALLGTGCLPMTRTRFELNRGKLACAIDRECHRRKCENLGASRNPLDRRMHELTCPDQGRCVAPDYGGWYHRWTTPRADCFQFEARRARRCLAELEAQLAACPTLPIVDDIWCWQSPPSCSEVYRSIPWPKCPLTR